MVKVNFKFGSVIVLLVLVSAVSYLVFDKYQSTSKNDVIATVNGQKMAKSYYEKSFAALAENSKILYANDAEGFLDELITREILYQAAESTGIIPKVSTVSLSDEQQRKVAAIRALLTDVLSKVSVSDSDIHGFYDANVAEMKGKSFDEVKTEVGAYLLREKQEEAINNFVEDLQRKAIIVKNQEWLDLQSKKSQNPIYNIIANGKPTVLDLGASTCIPCKMMKPIFEDLSQQYHGKANIVLLEIAENQDLARKFRVRVIPTQIFFDKAGKEYWRHEGFLAKEEIETKLQYLGAK